LILSLDGQEARERTLEIIERADFYHLGSFPKDIEGISWENYLGSSNTLIQYFGPDIELDALKLYGWHRENKVLGLSCGDYTFLKDAPFFHHINIMCDFSGIKPCSEPSDIIRICHHPSDQKKDKTELFLSAVEDLKTKGLPVEIVLIEEINGEEHLDIKSRCHMTFDGISTGPYGLSAIESMAAGHAVLRGISNFTSSYNPDNPIIYVTEENLHKRLEYLLTNKREITRIGNGGKIWARANHDPMKIIRQYAWIYDLVMSGHRVVDDRDRFLLK
jgi:hypothetical protein